MADNYSYDPFGGTDPFGGQQSVTPGFNSLKTTGTNKLLVVLFVVDCSRSMEPDRIMAVNAALREVKSTLQDIKNDNGLDLKIAIMSFTSNVRWELQLTDIDEVVLEKLKTRPGLTEYGNAFHELNKVLKKDQFMNHTGKIAPPAIMFLTDGGPTDDYEADLEELLKNGWFANASRSAVLLGEAIRDDAAKNAVRRFVEDPENDIVDAENSTVIIQKIKIATMHTVAGDPMNKGNVDSGNVTPAVIKKDDTDGVSLDVDSSKNGSGTDPFKVDPTDPFGGNDPFGGSGDAGGNDPFGGSGDAGGNDPFGGSGDAGGNDPFGGSGTAGGNDPFGGSGDAGGNDPFSGSGDAGGNDPFSGSGDAGGNDPFGGSGTAGGSDPFGGSGTVVNDDPFGGNGTMGGNDPFGGSIGGDDPFAVSGGDDPFGGMM